MMRNRIAPSLAIGLFACLAPAAVAQTNGSGSHGTAPAAVTSKIIGTVYDSENRQPLVGGMVMIEGTSLGNVTNDDGYYFIADVPAGTHAIRAEYLGYASVTRELVVPPGQTVTVDFALPSEVVLADAITAIVEREPIPIDETIDRPYTLTSEIQLNMPDELPQESCQATVTVHGSYIVGGQWQLQASVGRLVCGNQRIECRPVVVYVPVDQATAEDGAEGTDPEAAKAVPPAEDG